MTTLTHIVGTGPKDELHHLLCTIGAPTLMITRTPIGAKLQVDYKRMETPDGYQAINYTKKADHSFGLTFSRVRLSSCFTSLYPKF